MKQLRPIARVVIIHDDQIMLVRNRNANFWYPPGGGWEFEGESLPECAKREVKEETNYDVTIDRMLWYCRHRQQSQSCSDDIFSPFLFSFPVISSQQKRQP